MATVAAITVQGQAAAPAAKNTSTWKVPRTPDGKPDLQGTWSNNSVTPLERPRQWEGKKYLTDAEIEEVRKLTADVTEEGGDAVFGVTVSGREGEGLGDIVGVLLNTVPMWTRARPHDTVRAYLSDVQAARVEAPVSRRVAAIRSSRRGATGPP